MSPILSRLYSAPGGTEALDVLMKYMYVAAQSRHTPSDRLLPIDGAILHLLVPSPSCSGPVWLTIGSYKGMAHSTAASTSRNITPQATGFSQVHARGGGEGGGQAMSVLLSWHEKVCSLHFPIPSPPTSTQCCGCGGALQRRVLTLHSS
jgi:actin related protein 2/3 complex subunit 5